MEYDFFKKNEILKQLADLFMFQTGVFPSLLKTEKVVPIFKYCPISLLSNTKKLN